MNFSQNLVDAIDNYFKMKYHDGSGFFAPGTKQAACQTVCDAGSADGFSVEIVPGLIILRKDDTYTFVGRENQSGISVPCSDPNPLKTYFEKVNESKECNCGAQAGAEHRPHRNDCAVYGSKT